jgi:anion-transporting  ArsA/GET3 family ATPase
LEGNDIAPRNAYICEVSETQRSMKQEIHFVTGKGGVGKSVVAAALALKKSKEGKRVLLIELGNQSFFRDFFDLNEVTFRPVSLRPQLDVALWSGDACLHEYARHLIKVESLAKLFFENAVMRAFINVAPGLPELAILGKLTSGPRHHGPPLPYDCLVVDAYASGHFQALISAPAGMAEAIQFGPMGEQSRGIDKCLRDKTLCHYHIVTLPEELPVKEAIELQKKLEADLNIQGEVIINKVFKADLPLEIIEKYKTENTDLGKFANYMSYQLSHQNEMKNKIIQAVHRCSEVPLQFEVRSWPLIEKIAESLS